MEGERDQDHKTTRERRTSFNNDEDPYGKLAPPSRWRRVPTSYTLTDLLTLSDSFQIGVCRPLPPPIHLCSLPSSLAFRPRSLSLSSNKVHALATLYREPTMRFRSGEIEWSVSAASGDVAIFHRFDGCYFLSSRMETGLPPLPSACKLCKL